MPPSARTGHRLRDPAAPGRLGALVLAALLLWPLLRAAEVDPSALWAAQHLQVLGGFVGQFFPPEHSTDFLPLLARATLETLAIATAGLALALLLAVPLAYGASNGARERARWHPMARSVLALLRGVPELVWALVFVRVFGLGPAAGVLALGLTYGGMLGKVYAEILESVPPRPPWPCAAAARPGRWHCSMACCRRRRVNSPRTASTAGNARCAPRSSWALSAPAAWASSWTSP